MREAITDSLIEHPQGPVTVADQIAFEEFTDEQKRTARLVLREELEDEIAEELNVELTDSALAEVRGQNAALTAALIEVRKAVNEMKPETLFKQGWDKFASEVNATVKEALE